MARKFFRRFLPHPHAIRDHKSLRLLKTRLQDPNLWHLNRHSVSVAMFVGVFVAFIPIPVQMLVAAAAALVLRCNVALAVALVWITNPLTMPAIYYGTYLIGSHIMGLHPEATHFEFSMQWLRHQWSIVWQPLYLGSLITGLALGSLSYLVMRIVWRIGVQLKWRQRAQHRSKSKTDHS